MKSAAFLDRVTMGEVLAGLVVLVTALLFTGFGFAGSENHHSLRLLLEKHIITQEEYYQAVQEEDRAMAEEEQRVKQAHALTKGWL